MKRYLLYIVLTVVLSTAGCTRGQWLDEVVAQRDEQEDVVPILRAAQAKGLTVDSAEEIERTNKYYTVDTANGYYNEFKRYRVVFSDQTTVEFDVLGLFNGVQNDYYEERGLDYIGYIDLVNVLGNLVIDIVQSDDMIVSLSFMYTTPNGGENTPENNKIYYTSTDGQVVTPNDTTAFGANIVSNTYKNGQGVITFDGNVTKIGDSAFYDCLSLASITIPDSVTSIGSYAFYACSSLAEVYCKATTPPTAVPNYYSSYWRAFDDNASGRKIYVPAESVEAYKTTHYWSNYADAFVPYDFENGEEIEVEVPEPWEIYYTSTDGNVVTPYYTTVFGANIVSNTYKNGKGVITFDGNVTKIGGQAFYNCSSLASVTIPEGVTSIESYVFVYCYSLIEFKGKFASEDGRCLIVDGEFIAFAPAGLTEYTIPEGVTSIGSYAFYNCKSLTSITIPDSVTSIGKSAFYNCTNITSITIPDSVTSIEMFTFCCCRSLASITIPDGVTSIGSDAFSNCSSLAEVYCKPTTPPTADLGGYSSWGAFDYNASGRKIYVPTESVGAYKTAEWWSDYADDFVAYDFEKGEEVNLESRKIYYTSTDGNVVTPYATNVFGANIVSNTYENGRGVITFAGNVTTIGSHAFESCTSLTSITIPEGVTEIGYQAFYGCSSLASVTLPDSVTEIGGQAFYGCTALTSVTIPDGVTSIGSYVFAGCSGLTEFKGQLASNDGRCLIINGAIHSFAPAGLTGYAIPEGVTSIVATAFYGCASLISITIPDSVTYIGEWAFKDCLSLTSVYCMPTTPPTGGTGRFDNGVVGRKIYVPAESIEAYKSANYWSDYADDFVAYDFEKGEVVNLESRKIYYTSTNGNVVTPYNSGTSYFGANIVSNTYENGQGVITFDGNVTEIGNRTFYDCSSLASITIPDSVTSIGYDAFEHCSSLASVTIGNGVTSIGFEAFYQCSSLASIIIPEGVTEIGFMSFAGCLKLTSITIPNSVTSIGNHAFYDCSSLVSITIPEGVTEIGYSAFYKCSSLASITIPDSVTSIGESAFSSCSSLAEVYCKPTTPPTAVPSYNSTFNAFDNNASGRKIYVPEESVEAYKTAQYWSEYADAIEPYVFE